MLLRLWLLVPVIVGQFVSGEDVFDQVVVFDAGSSGTRVHIFSLTWNTEAKRASFPGLGDWKKQKVWPGLSTFVDNLEGAQEQIQTLLKFANEHVDEGARSRTPVMLKATAGLRAADPDKAEAVLETVRNTLKASGYFFKPEMVATIQGKEEGGLAWVATNYLEGNFKDQDDKEGEGAADAAPSPSQDGGDKGGESSSTAEKEKGGGAKEANDKEDKDEKDANGEASAVRAMRALAKSDIHTTGIIEMGGGSAQVAFEIKSDKKDVAESDDFTFTTGRGKAYRVYAHSYLGYGANSARIRLQTLLPAGELTDPCYPVDYTRSVPQANGKDPLVVKGSGDAKSCQASVEKGLLAPDDAPGKYASQLPLEDGDYLALKAFFKSQDAYDLHLDNKPLELKAFQDANELACTKKLKKPVIEEQGDDPKKVKKKARQCFGFAYEIGFLQALKAFSPGINAQIVRQVGDDDVEWSLGAALIHHIEAHDAASFPEPQKYKPKPEPKPEPEPEPKPSDDSPTNPKTPDADPNSDGKTDPKTDPKTEPNNSKLSMTSVIIIGSVVVAAMVIVLAILYCRGYNAREGQARDNFELAVPQGSAV